MVITEDIITTNANEEQRLGKKLFSCCMTHCSHKRALDCGKLLYLLSQRNDILLVF